MWASLFVAPSFPKAIFSKSKLLFWIVLTRSTLRTEPPFLLRMRPEFLFPSFNHLTHLARLTHLTCLTLVTFLAGGCATYKRSGLPPERVQALQKQFHPPALSPELED